MEAFWKMVEDLRYQKNGFKDCCSKKPEKTQWELKKNANRKTFRQKSLCVKSACCDARGSEARRGRVCAHAALRRDRAEIVCSDDWPVQPFDFCVHRAAEEAPGEGGGDAGEQALDAREPGLRSPVILRFSVRAASLATPVAPISTIHSMASVWSRQTRILSWPPRSWNQKHPNFQHLARI